MPWLYSFNWSEADSENRGDIHTHCYTSSVQMHPGTVQYLYVLCLNLLKSHIFSLGPVILVSWSWHGEISFPRMTNREFTWLPLRQGYEGLLKAYLWSAVGCVCVWERDSQILNVCSDICFVSMCGCGERMRVHLKKSSYIFLSFSSNFSGPFLLISETMCLLGELRKIKHNLKCNIFSKWYSSYTTHPTLLVNCRIWQQA